MVSVQGNRRSAGDAKSLPGHANGDITTHYTAAERQELLNTAEMIVDRSNAQTPTLKMVG
ncbi:hypothetical protein [Candidatus Thiodiazotropha sp. LNASS1]|uniref:hypothetical protein n=1 Tax=Candidatus Thiodiazotropha sp. LNASS1 TaxID=3096260 RepID=UPI00348BC8DF